MRRFLLLPSSLLLTAALATPALAQMIANPARPSAPSSANVAGAFVMSEVEYDDDDFPGDIDIERKMLAGEAGYGVAPNVDVFGQLGFIFDTEVEDADIDGSGFMFGGGARFSWYDNRPVRAVGYALLNMTMETFDGDNVEECESELTDMHAGSVLVYAASSFAPYAGLDLALHSDGELECEFKSGGKGKFDIERDDVLNLRLGATIDFNGLYFHPEAILMGESTFILAVGTRL